MFFGCLDYVTSFVDNGFCNIVKVQVDSMKFWVIFEFKKTMA